MSTLKDLLLGDSIRPRVVSDTVRLIDEEVDKKGGISGFAIKAAFKTVKAVKPGLIPETVDHLLDRFVATLEPLFKEWCDAGKRDAFDAFLLAQKHRVANALLSVTDERARVATHHTLKKAYETLRPQGEKHVEAAVPALSGLLRRYVT